MMASVILYMIAQLMTKFVVDACALETWATYGSCWLNARLFVHNNHSLGILEIDRVVNIVQCNYVASWENSVGDPN